MAEGFHDVSFPDGIALGSRGGPMRRTEVVTLSSGHEQRAARWAQSRRRWNAGYGVKSVSDIEALIAFFEAREGRRFAFRWRDPFDHGSAPFGQVPSATDQVIGTGDGEKTVFGLIKHYAPGGSARPITKPVPGSVIVAIDGAPAVAEIGTLDGLVTFAVPPAAGASVTAGFLFDVPARFDTDELIVSVEPGGGDVPDIPIIEVRV